MKVERSKTRIPQSGSLACSVKSEVPDSLSHFLTFNIHVEKLLNFTEKKLAGAGGFEPPNAGIKSQCLRPLGYAPPF
jgi:hypothetical protein